MPVSELLWFIFVDELIGSLIVPINDTYVIDAAVILKGLDISYLFTACFGAISGQICNYYFGKFSIKALRINIEQQKKEVILVLYGMLLLIPFGFFGTLATFLCGIIGLRFSRFILGSSSVTIFYFILKFLYY